MNFIQWRWNPVEGVSGYDVQFSTDAAFTGGETVALAAEQTSYLREDLEPETSYHLRMRSALGTGGDRLTSAWTLHATGMTTAPSAPAPPAVPNGLMVSGRGMNFIQWRWNPVEGVSGYDVQFSTDAAFTGGETVALAAEQTSYLREDLEPETSYHLRMRSALGTGGDRLTSAWTLHATGMTTAPSAPREVPHIPLDVSSRQLGRLFDDIIDKTARREAFSEVKEKAMSFSALEDMKALREEFIASTSEAELYYALVKLSNARRDRHLRVSTVDDGIKSPDVWRKGPIRVLPDYSDLQNPSFFVAASRLSSPEPGDRIVAVNGRTTPEYVEEFTPWVSHSTLHGLYWEMATYLPWVRGDVPLNLYLETLLLTLESDSGNRYEVSLNYSGGAPGIPRSGYAGFDEVMRRENFNVLVDRSQQMVLLEWLDFEYSLIQDIVELMELAQRDQLLDYDMIIDVTNSSGGSRGAYAIQRLVDRPFRTTFGNVRLSDAGIERIRRYQNRRPDHSQPDIFGLNLSRSWLIDWARTDARQAILRGDEYTPPVPFKLAHLPKDSDGFLQPAPVHFRGRVVIISGPRGGSHLDQFVAMFADNDLAVVVGMPTGGFSNTWEHEEDLYFAGTGRPVTRFMWSIGHTIRPNGEVLEGNPAWPDIYIPLTRDNFRTYYDTLLEEAIAVLRN